jgi:hypothetical protein
LVVLLGRSRLQIQITPSLFKEMAVPALWVVAALVRRAMPQEARAVLMAVEAAAATMLAQALLVL